MNSRITSTFKASTANFYGFNKYSPGRELGKFYQKFEQLPPPQVARISLLKKLGLPVDSKIPYEKLVDLAQKRIIEQSKPKIRTITEMVLEGLAVFAKVVR